MNCYWPDSDHAAGDSSDNHRADWGLDDSYCNCKSLKLLGQIGKIKKPGNADFLNGGPGWNRTNDQSVMSRLL